MKHLDGEKRREGKDIKMEIIDVCWAKPEGRLEIARKLKCNWSTIKKYVDELVDEKILGVIYISKQVGYYVNQNIKDINFHLMSIQDEVEIKGLPDEKLLKKSLREIKKRYYEQFRLEELKKKKKGKLK